MPLRSATNKFGDKEKVFAKMLGYPWWPAFITPDEYIPKNVLKARKKSTPYCVIFIPDGDFYWCNDKAVKEYKPGTAKDTSKLDAKAIARLKDVKYLKKRLTTVPKKPATFPEAIVASEKLAFNDFIKIFQEGDDEDDEDEEDEEVEEDAEEEDEVQEDEVEEPEVPVKKSAPTKSRNRSDTKLRRSSRSQDVEDEAEDGDVEDQYQEEIPKNKRKRGSVVQASTNGKKRKLTDADDTEEPATESHKKPKLENSSDEDTASAAGAAAASIKSGKAPVNDEEKQHQLYLCRIKLQRTLIQRDLVQSPPTADELLLVRLILYRLVNFPVDKELLKKTKLYKVMRYIIKNRDLEYADSFKLHELCKEILEKWDPFIQQILYEKEHSNSGKSSNANARLLSVKNGGSGFNDDSEVSGIEQSLPEIDQSKDEESEPSEKKDGEKPQGDEVKGANGVEVKDELKSSHDTQSNHIGSESLLQKNVELPTIKAEGVTGEANSKEETKESESTAAAIKSESKDDRPESQSESVATKETTAPSESTKEAQSVPDITNKAEAAVNAIVNP